MASRLERGRTGALPSELARIGGPHPRARALAATGGPPKSAMRTCSWHSDGACCRRPRPCSRAMQPRASLSTSSVRRPRLTRTAVGAPDAALSPPLCISARTGGIHAVAKVVPPAVAVAAPQRRRSGTGGGGSRHSDRPGVHPYGHGRRRRCRRRCHGAPPTAATAATAAGVEAAAGGPVVTLPPAPPSAYDDGGDGGGGEGEPPPKVARCATMTRTCGCGQCSRSAQTAFDATMSVGGGTPAECSSNREGGAGRWSDRRW